VIPSCWEHRTQIEVFYFRVSAQENPHGGSEVFMIDWESGSRADRAVWSVAAANAQMGQGGFDVANESTVQ
jgi:hypothetical protein